MNLKGLKHEGEVWHLYKILNELEKPNTQMYICKKCQVANHKLIIYLKKLKKLGFVIEMKYDGSHNIRAKVWQTTAIGNDFKSIIEQYVKLKG